MAMKVELKEKWLEALRSRKFKQGQGSLKEVVDAEKGKTVHCCLGVLHEISGGKWHKNSYDRRPEGEYEGEFWTGTRTTGSTSNCYLEGNYRKGLDGDTQKTLAEMNDNGKKFYEIAKWIEKNVPTK